MFKGSNVAPIPKGEIVSKIGDAGKTVITKGPITKGINNGKAKTDQPWKIREGQEYKEKIIGKAQKTGPGHDTKSYREAIKAAKDKTSEKVYLNQGINKITGAKKGDKHYVKPNRRPDVAIKRKDGKIDQIEVPSKSDDPKLLRKRMEDTHSKLPKEMQGGRRDIKELNSK